MSNMLVGFLFGAGFAAWLYSKLYRSSGGNTQSTLIVAATCGVGVMVLAVILLNAFA